jgi:hypothetical protein
MLSRLLRVTLPKKRLVIEGQGEFTGELSLGAPVVSLAPCKPATTLANVLVWRLVGDIRRTQYQAINAAQVLSILKNNDVHQ